LIVCCLRDSTCEQSGCGPTLSSVIRVSLRRCCEVVMYHHGYASMFLQQAAMNKIRFCDLRTRNRAPHSTRFRAGSWRTKSWLQRRFCNLATLLTHSKASKTLVYSTSSVHRFLARGHQMGPHQGQNSQQLQSSLECICCFHDRGQILQVLHDISSTLRSSITLI